VGQAKSKSANATRQVEKALDDVQAIIEELNQLPNIGEIFTVLPHNFTQCCVDGLYSKDAQ
jgi:hypothetical protein